MMRTTTAVEATRLVWTLHPRRRRRLVWIWTSHRRHSTTTIAGSSKPEQATTVTWLPALPARPNHNKLPLALRSNHRWLVQARICCHRHSTDMNALTDNEDYHCSGGSGRNTVAMDSLVHLRPVPFFYLPHLNLAVSMMSQCKRWFSAFVRRLSSIIPREAPC